MQETLPPKPLDSAAVMSHLGISRNTYWKYVREYPRQFRTFKSGKKRLMDVADLEKWKAFRKREDAL